MKKEEKSFSFSGIMMYCKKNGKIKLKKNWKNKKIKIIWKKKIKKNLEKINYKIFRKIEIYYPKK